MLFKEFGNKNNPTILLIHGGGLSWWSWKAEIDILERDYFVVVAIIDGHGEDYKTPFISIENSADKIIHQINEFYKGKVYGICGLSIGAQIVTEILSKSPEISKNCIIESALLIPMELTIKLVVPMYNVFYGLIGKRWYAKIQSKTLNISEANFEDYYHDSCLMTKESLINITKSNGNYRVPSTITECNSNVIILVGSKELSIMIKSARLLHGMIESSQLLILQGYNHGEISLKNPKEYVGLINQYFR